MSVFKATEVCAGGNVSKDNQEINQQILSVQLCVKSISSYTTNPNSIFRYTESAVNSIDRPTRSIYFL